MESALTLRYRCRYCPHDFGDPEKEGEFTSWAESVIEHTDKAHGITPHYLNDMLKPIWMNRPTQ